MTYCIKYQVKISSYFRICEIPEKSYVQMVSFIRATNLYVQMVPFIRATILKKSYVQMVPLLRATIIIIPKKLYVQMKLNSPYTCKMYGF